MDAAGTEVAARIDQEEARVNVLREPLAVREAAPHPA